MLGGAPAASGFEIDVAPRVNVMAKLAAGSPLKLIRPGDCVASMRLTAGVIPLTIAIAGAAGGSRSRLKERAWLLIPKLPALSVSCAVSCFCPSRPKSAIVTVKSTNPSVTFCELNVTNLGAVANGEPLSRRSRRSPVTAPDEPKATRTVRSPTAASVASRNPPSNRVDPCSTGVVGGSGATVSITRALVSAMFVPSGGLNELSGFPARSSRFPEVNVVTVRSLELSPLAMTYVPVNVVPCAIVESVTTAPLSSVMEKLLFARTASLIVAVMAMPPTGVPTR